MKKIYIFLIAMFLCALSNAQLQKGTILVEGDIGFDGAHYSDQFDAYYDDQYDVDAKYSAIYLNPKFGYFTSESLVLGIGILYRYEKEYRNYQNFNYDITDIRKEKEYLLQLNPYLTKYSKLGENIYFTSTVDLYAGFGKSRSTYEDIEKESNILELQISARPGIIYFISDNWALSGSIGQIYYNYRVEKPDTNYDFSENVKNVHNQYRLDFSLNDFYVGIIYYFTKNN